MGSRVLVFNRGEIAVRACSAARALGLTPILFVTPDDRDGLATRYAGDLYACERSEPSASFLSLDEVARAVHATRADFVYPGYGFLSETEELCLAVEEAGARFVGPRASTLRMMAHKAHALDLARRAGIADLSLSLRTDDDGRLLAPPADAFPILLKAAKGGGGRGNALVTRPDDFPEALARLRERARALFRDDAVLAERYLSEARHVELQIFGVRGHGVRLLGTRDCSLQRNYQKVIEEGPVAPRVREALDAHVPALLRELDVLGYEGAGTVELLWDPRAERLYFIEVNPRIQVEHTVTELLTGEDLVEWQLREAADLGREDLLRRDVIERGHAVQARVYAEDPLAAFAPDAGTVTHLDLPPVRFCHWDTGFSSGASISTHYDPLIAKLVVSGRTRVQTLARASACLRATAIHGVQSNVSFLTDLMDHETVRADAHHVRWIEDTFLPAFALAERARVASLDVSDESLFGRLAKALGAGASKRSSQPTDAEGQTWKRRHRI